MEGVHDVPVSSVCSTPVCLTACAEIEDMSLRSSLAIEQRRREVVAREFGSLHATFEVECPNAR